VVLLTAIYEQITETAVHPASPEKQFIQWVANVIVQERVLNNVPGPRPPGGKGSGVPNALHHL